ncbi:MAG: hypothetical protein ACTSQO_12630 [Candidatus Helarchaeota archaeon]
MYGEFVYIDNYLSFVLVISVLILVASFMAAQISKKYDKLFYIICAAFTVIIIINLGLYYAWPYI